jgi:hypothetical protein
VDNEIRRATQIPSTPHKNLSAAEKRLPPNEFSF